MGRCTNLDMSATELHTLAGRLLADLDEAEACLLASADGRVVDVAPQERADRARHAWERLASLGAPERGFVVVEGEMWAFVRRDGCLGLIVAASSAVPGSLLDRLEAALAAGVEDPGGGQTLTMEGPVANGDSAKRGSMEGPVRADDGSVDGVDDPSAPNGAARRGGPNPDVDLASFVGEFASLASDRERPEA